MPFGKGDKVKPVLPEPLKSHKVRSLSVKVLFGLLMVHIGLFIIVAAYYLGLETSTFDWLTKLLGFHPDPTWHVPATKQWWDTLVPNSEKRHLYRSVGEGFLGFALLGVFTWSHYKKGVTKKANLLDKLEIKLRIPNVKQGRPVSGFQYAIALPLALLYSVPGWFIGQKIVNAGTKAINFVSPIVGSHSSYFDKVASVWTNDAPHIIVGLFGSYFFGRRVLKAIFDDIQRVMVDRRIALNKPLHWYHNVVPTFQARYNERKESAYSVREGYLIDHPHRFPVLPTLLALAIPAGIALAGYGYYVLTVIAVAPVGK
jgi:hypothetical protein